MLKRLVISMFLFSALVGCATTQQIFVDGMPVSDHEYVATTPEGLRVAFVLTRYYNKKFDDESMIYPEYLDVWDTKNRIDIDNTESLILHVKVVNIKRIKLTVWCILDGPDFKQQVILYQGKLPRKDVSIQMPITKIGKHEFEVALTGNGEEYLNVWGKYQNERGEK